MFQLKVKVICFFRIIPAFFGIIIFSCIKYVFLLPFYFIINWRELYLTGYSVSTYIYLSVCKIKGMMVKEAIAVILAVDKNTHMRSYQRFYHIFAEDLSWAELYNFRF